MVALEGCLLGIGEADRDAKGEGRGDAIRRSGAVTGLKATSSPSSSPEMSLGARGRSEEDAGVELVREKLPLVLFMAERRFALDAA